MPLHLTIKDANGFTYMCNHKLYAYVKYEKVKESFDYLVEHSIISPSITKATSEKLYNRMSCGDFLIFKISEKDFRHWCGEYIYALEQNGFSDNTKYSINDWLRSIYRVKGEKILFWD